MGETTDTPDAAGTKKRARGKRGPVGGEWKPRFIEVLQRGGTASAAAKEAGVNRTHAHDERHRDEQFSLEWADAREEFGDMLEGVAVRRATVGVEKGIWHRGEKVGTEREVSDTLLIFLLKAERPHRFRDNYVPEPGASPAAPRVPILGERDPVEFDPEERDAAARALLSGLDDLPPSSED